MNMLCFTSTLSWFTLVILNGFLPFASGQQNTVSLITFKYARKYPVMHRSNALKKKTVLLETGDSLKIPLCVRRDAEYKISGVRYANDGGTDSISLWLNSQKIGSFNSIEKSNYGLLWNVFHDSGQIGSSMNLKFGTYMLELRVESTDFYRIEIDAIFLQTTDVTVGEGILECVLSCMHNYQPDVHEFNSSATPMQLVQRSIPTKCAEQDNIDVAIFHNYVTRYQIKASYPKYNSSLNSRDAIFENCEQLSPELLWRLKEKPSDPAQNIQTNLTSFEQNLVKEKPLIIHITFILKGKADGLIDSDIGSVLNVHFQNVTNSFNVSCRYITRNGHYTDPTKSVVTEEQQTVNFSMPDYTWTEHEVNTIQLILTSPLDEVVKINTIELSRRDENGQTKTKIYQSSDILIEGRNVDFWWRRPRTMVIKIKNETVKDIDFIVIYKRQPSTTRFNQILVIYQDGNFRILPLPPKDIDWTPFGSSTIIGQSELPSFRPVAEISLIDIVSITADVIQLRLHYFDGGSALITISTSDLKTVLDVSQLHFNRPLKKYPFARFRSMWVKDGNCDVDHMRVNGGQEIEILQPWKQLNGSLVEFFRLCESEHLNLSPDITLQVLS